MRGKKIECPNPGEQIALTVKMASAGLKTP